MKCAPIWVKTDNLINEYVIGGKRAFFQGRTGWEPRSTWDGLSAPPFKILRSLRFGFNVESHNHWLDEACRFEFMGWMAMLPEKQARSIFRRLEGREFTTGWGGQSVFQIKQRLQWW